MEEKSDIIESYKLEIKSLETQRDLFLVQVWELIAKKKQIVTNLLGTPLPFED